MEVEQILKATGTMLEGHFLLTSKLHSPIYWEKFRILQQPHYAEQLCAMIAKHFYSQGIQLVAGPTMGGIILAYEVAKQIGVRAIFAERGTEGRVFRGGVKIMPDERVLVVDDILTTGSSVREVINEIQRQGGTVAGIGILIDRSPNRVDFGAPLFSCYRTQAPVYTPQECPLCAAGIPLVQPGGLKIKEE